MGLTFFGLTPEYRTSLFTQIHEIVFHGKGGYTWSEVYNMPIWLRRFTFKKIDEYYTKEREEQEKALKKLQAKKSAPGKVHQPPKVASYNTKASK